LLWENISRFNPDIVAASAFAACNVYSVLRTLEIAKGINPKILTVTGGQHFTATAHESLEKYPEIDVIVRGEGEETLTELVKNSTRKSQFPKIKGMSFRHNGKLIHNEPRPLIKDLVVPTSAHSALNGDTGVEFGDSRSQKESLMK